MYKYNKNLGVNEFDASPAPALEQAGCKAWLTPSEILCCLSRKS